MTRGALRTAVATFVACVFVTAWAPVIPRPGRRVVGVVTDADHPDGPQSYLLVPVPAPWHDRDWVWRDGWGAAERTPVELPPDLPVGTWITDSGTAVQWDGLAVQAAVIAAVGGLLALAFQTAGRRRRADADVPIARPVGCWTRSRRRVVGVAVFVAAAAAAVAVVWPLATVERSAVPAELPRDGSLMWGANPPLFIDIQVEADGFQVRLRDGFEEDGAPERVERAAALDALHAILAREAQRFDRGPMETSIGADASVASGRLVAAWQVVRRFNEHRLAGLLPPEAPAAPIAAPTPSGKPLRLPVVSAAETYVVAAEVSADLFIGRHGALEVRLPSDAPTSRQPFQVWELDSALRAAALAVQDDLRPGLSALTLFLHVDRETPWGHVAPCIEACARVGIWRLAFVVEPEPAASGE